MRDAVTFLLAGHRVHHLARCDSTNALAREGAAAGTLQPGDVVVADRQEAGRGRRGRTWVTLPAGRALAVSIVLRPPALPRPARLTLLAAVAAARALEACGARDIGIKWPNDLIRADRKIGGLLVEGAQRGLPARRVPPAVVLGLGLNLELHPGDLPAGLALRVGDAGLPALPATAPESPTLPRTPTGPFAPDDRRGPLLARLLGELDAALAEAGTPADQARGEEYRRRSWLTGRTVRLRDGTGERSVRIVDVSADGDLLAAPGGWLRGETVELLEEPFDPA